MSKKANTGVEMIASHDPPGPVAETAAEQTEIAFVPVSERQYGTRAAPDMIITVGHRSQQKKKRKRNPGLNGAEDNAEMFDYTVEQNLLDADDLKGGGPATKKRNRGESI